MKRAEPIKKSNQLLIALCILSVANIYIHVVPSLLMAFMILISQFFLQSKHDFSVVFVLFSAVIGAFFVQHGIRYIGVVFMMTGMICLLPDLFKQPKRLQKPFLFLLLVLFFLLLSSVLSTGGSYAKAKFLSTAYNSLLFFVAYSHLILYPEKHEGTSLSLMVIVYSAFMLSFMTELMGSFSISDALSYDVFRGDLSDLRAAEEDVFVYNYQQIGLYSLIGLCLFFYNKQGKLNIAGWVILSSSFLIAISCQSRQSLLTFVILLIFLFVDLKKIRISRILFVALLVMILYYWLMSLNADTVSFLTGQDEILTTSKRSIIRATAIDTFLSNPITGVGYGRFYCFNSYGVNEHNIILEILAELGLLGFSLFGLLSYTSVSGVQRRHLHDDYKWLMAVLLAYFLRFMVSSDLREGIVFFIILFLMSTIKKHKFTT